MQLGDSVTGWLHLWRTGDQEAIERVTELVYRDLRRLAAYYLEGESNASTLQATALVHEAYLQIGSIRELDWKGRGQFISVVAQMMRRVLIDHARRRKAAKRNSALALEAAAMGPEFAHVDILAVDQVLDRMTVSYPRCVQVVELRFFGGLEFPEIAGVLDVSLTTVERDWRFARAFLQRQMTAS
jgi:RNA polymerase sigma factor (TIGR02999 family)